MGPETIGRRSRSLLVRTASNAGGRPAGITRRLLSARERFGARRSLTSDSRGAETGRTGSFVRRRTQAAWVLAFLGFPLGGAAAFGVVGPVDTVVSGAIAGAIAGAVIGAAQWLVLRRVGLASAEWVAASSVGLAAGLAIGVALFGSDTGISDLLLRGVVAGALIGGVQWVLLRGRVADAYWWVPVVAAGWVIGWTVTWAVGVDVSVGWAVFGASGAIVFQLITGGALRSMVRSRGAARGE